MTADEPVTIAHFPFPTAAEAARLRLEAEGIPAFLADAETVGLDWIKLEVPASEAERAATILQQTERRRLIRRWRPASGPSELGGDTTMADQDDVDPDEIDDLERQIYGLRLHIATLYRLLTSKGICTPEEIQSVMEKVDAEDGANDEEFFGDVIGPSSGEP
jgi:hypothetical protein